MIARSRSSVVGPLAILLLTVLIVAVGALVLGFVVLQPDAAVNARPTFAPPPSSPRPNGLKTVPWTQGVDPLLPHTLVVGVDIEPGTYTSKGASAGNPNVECTWARLRDLAGGDGDVIDSGETWGPVTVTILATDKGFVTGGCSEWVGPSPG